MKKDHLTSADNAMPGYCLRKRPGSWQLTFAGQRASFKHEQWATYVA